MVPGKIDGYDLNQPTRQMILPHFLMEASGLTDISATEVAVVQDESGSFFVYDLMKQKVTKSVTFGPAGDYEGMTRVKDCIYILKSNGELYKVDHWRSNPTVTSQRLRLSTTDNEGLGWDPGAKKLLIAPKSRWQNGKEFKNLRPVFFLAPENIAVSPEVALTVDVEEILRFAEENGLSLPSSKTKKGKTKVRLHFRPASIAVHPKTGEFFIISAVDRTLASFDRSGKVTGFQHLPASLFRQPEGITFLPDNTMVIINEAAGHQPTILRYEWKQSP
ncbi:MAG: hypothetical protein JXR45_22185 [Deltaproteobacteria bacterium]|nr:hypothetical protein [Deltaproteobacteria bacterium]